MTQRIAYVTGGMGGIGTSICRKLHDAGHRVIAGCGPTRDAQKWLDEQKKDGYTFYASVGLPKSAASMATPTSSSTMLVLRAMVSSQK